MSSYLSMQLLAAISEWLGANFMWIRLIILGLFYFFKRNIWNFLVIFALLGIAALAVWQSALDNGGIAAAWTSGLWLNFATELLGAILTFAMFEVLISANNRQEELIRQLRSHDNNTVLHAVNELRVLGYLFDGTLYGANLRGADLTGADLRGAYLRGVKADEETILPDGTRWQEGLDWRRFTSPESQIRLKQRPKTHYSRKYRARRMIY
jgi:hypothetical protein